MPYYRKYGRRQFRRRPRAKRTLAPKSIKRRKSANAQSKQILSLARQVKMLTRTNTSLIRTSWARGQERIQTLTSSGTPFICPIPYHMMDPNDSFTPGSGITTTWRSNLFQVPAFRKKLVFGTADAAINSNKIRHTGSVIKWQMESTEASYSKVTLLLVRAKRGMADQLAADRALLGTSVPYGPDGSSDHFKRDVDYVVHDIPTSITSGGSNTFHSVTWNTKYWDVLYQKQVAFGHPNAQGFIPQVMAANISPQNNAMVATGQIRMPACGMIRSTAKDPSGVTKACELGLVDQRNENACYLVAIQNGVAADLEAISLGWICVDYYKAAV